MIHAYDKTYLEHAQMNLGDMMDYACRDLSLPASDFFRLFSHSKLGMRFSHGVPAVIAGHSGTELVFELLRETGLTVKLLPHSFLPERSPEYWAGWAVCYYQWERNRSFEEISAAITMDEILSMYPKYHEQDVRQFSDALWERNNQGKMHTRLKAYRESLSMTQRELAEKSGVPIRTIQQYEQRQKDINKAHADTVYVIAATLLRSSEELIE